MAIVVEVSKREQVLRFIAEHRRRKDWAPTLEEIGHACDMSSRSTVHYYLVSLVNQGMLHREPGARCLRLTRAGKAFIEGSDA